MAERAKTRRRYDSPRRREQAAATRQQILEAAQGLFEHDGYAATSMAEIAKEAGVALKTVYVAFETKSGLLRALWHQLLRGGDDEIPVDRQPWYLEVLEEPDPERMLRLTARNASRVKGRAGALMEVIRNAAPDDPDIAALWSRIGTDFHENQRRIVEALHRRKALRRGLGVGRGADIMWAINLSDVWVLLVSQRGWTQAQYERWLGDTFCAQLLESAAQR